MLRCRRSALCVLLTLAAAIRHASFHHASPLVRDVLRFAKNLSHVEAVSNRRSSLALVSVVTSVISGRGNSANVIATCAE